MPTQSETTKVIAPAIFKVGSLLSLTFHGWSGSATLSDEDAEAFGRTRDNDFFRKNNVSLVSREFLKPFEQEQGKMQTFLVKWSLDFPIRGVRMVPHGNMRTVRDEMMKARTAYEEVARRFVEEYYPAERESRLDAFEQRHPGMRDRLATYFPQPQALQGKFGVSWMVYDIKDVEALDEIMAEEQQNFRGQMQNYLFDLAGEMRQKAAEAAIAFRRAMNKQDGVVRSTSIAAFVDFVDRFERNDFMNDSELREMLTSMRTQVHSVENWNIAANLKSVESIREGLDQLIQTAENDAAASLVTSSFLGISETEFSIEEAADVSTDLETSGGEVTTAVQTESEQELEPALS